MSKKDLKIKTKWFLNFNNRRRSYVKLNLKINDFTTWKIQN